MTALHSQTKIVLWMVEDKTLNYIVCGNMVIRRVALIT